MTSSTDRIERETLLKAPIARVWRALSSPDEFGTWFGVNLKGQQFTPGQWTRGNMTIKGFEHVVFEALIVEMLPEKRFTYRWHPYAVDPVKDYSKEDTTLVVMDLSETAGGTLLKVVESGFDKVPAERRAEAFRMNSGGWEGQLRNITKYVDSH